MWEDEANVCIVSNFFCLGTCVTSGITRLPRPWWCVLRARTLYSYSTISVFRFVRTRRKRDRICTSKPGAIRDSSSRMIKESNFHLVRTYTILNINQNFLNLMRRGKLQVVQPRLTKTRAVTVWRRERSEASSKQKNKSDSKFVLTAGKFYGDAGKDKVRTQSSTSSQLSSSKSLTSKLY